MKWNYLWIFLYCFVCEVQELSLSNMMKSNVLIEKFLR